MSHLNNDSLISVQALILQWYDAISSQVFWYTRLSSLSLKGVLWVLGALHRLLGQGVKEGGHWPGRLLLEGLQHRISDSHKVAIVPWDLAPHIQEVPDCIHLQIGTDMLGTPKKVREQVTTYW